jgi:hypothetical protein
MLDAFVCVHLIACLAVFTSGCCQKLGVGVSLWLSEAEETTSMNV